MTTFIDNQGDMDISNNTPVLNVSKTNTDENRANDNSTKSVEHNNDSELRQKIEKMNDVFRLTDSDSESGLDLFCYNKCSNEDDDFIKQCRGIVFHNDTIVMKAFPYTSEYNHEDILILNEVLKDFNNFSFYDSHEGALIRVFHYNNVWYTSTHRKLNAFRSSWASKDSFGTLFKQAITAEIQRNKVLNSLLPEGDNVLDRFYSTLDKTKQYMFLVLNNNDNRIVCIPPEEPMLYHVGTFIEGKLFLDENVNIQRPNKHNFKNVDELVKFVSTIDCGYLQGIIAFGPNNKQVKILNKEYQDLFRVRGNEPSIKFRYLQVRMNRKYSNTLYDLYPNMAETFDKYENYIYEIAQNIHKAYTQRFIKKNYTTVDRQEYEVIKKCHEWYLENRKNNTNHEVRKKIHVDLEKVIKVLNEQSPSSLNHMIRNLVLEKSKKNNNKLPREIKSPDVKPLTNTPILSPLLLNTNKTHLQQPSELKI